MGGGITTRVITVRSDNKAAAQYSAVSGDEAKNYVAIGVWSNGSRGNEERVLPADALPHISPMYFSADIQAAISIHHGLADPILPVQWSVQTCEQLKVFGKDVTCSYYDGMPHRFVGLRIQEFIQNTLQFSNHYLKAP